MFFFCFLGGFKNLYLFLLFIRFICIDIDFFKFILLGFFGIYRFEFWYFRKILNCLVIIVVDIYFFFFGLY